MLSNSRRLGTLKRLSPVVCQGVFAVPAFGQFESDVDVAFHAVAGRKQQGVAGGHQSLAGVVGHFLHARRPGVPVVFKRNVIANPHATLPGQFVVALTEVPDAEFTALAIAGGESPHQIGLAIGQRAGRLHAEHRQALAGHPDIGLHVGDPCIVIDGHDIAVALAVVGRRGGLCETGRWHGKEDGQHRSEAEW